MNACSMHRRYFQVFSRKPRQCSSQDLAQPGTSGPGTQFPTGSHFSPSLPQPGTIFFYIQVFLFTYNFFLFAYNFLVLFVYNCLDTIYVQFLYKGDALFYGPLPPPSLSTFLSKRERYMNKIRNNMRHNAS